MFCNQCGKKNPDDALFCNSCGSKIGTTNAGSSNDQKTPGKVLTSLIFGILSLFFFSY